LATYIVIACLRVYMVLVLRRESERKYGTAKIVGSVYAVQLPEDNEWRWGVWLCEDRSEYYHILPPSPPPLPLLFASLSPFCLSLSLFRQAEGVHYVLQVFGPNMNPNRPRTDLQTKRKREKERERRKACAVSVSVLVVVS